MAGLPNGSGQRTKRPFIGLALAAGFVGLLLNRFAVIPLFDDVKLVFGPVPVLMVAILFGWRAGLVAGALAVFGTNLNWGYDVRWLAAIGEAVAVGALARRLHPAVTVLGFWMLVGLPLYLVAARLDPAGFGALAGVAGIKAPLQELFNALLACTLLFLAPLRQAVSAGWPEARLPVVSLKTFQITFLTFSLLTVACSMALATAHHIYTTERDTLARYNQIATHSVAARFETMVNGYARAVTAMAARPWTPAEVDERRRTADQLIGPNGFQGLAWIADDYRMRDGWTLAEGSRLVRIAPGYDLRGIRPTGPPWADGNLYLQVLPRTDALREPVLRLSAPVPGGGFVSGVVYLSTIAAQLQAATPVTHSDIDVVDGQGRLLLNASPIGVVERTRAEHGSRPSAADLVHEMPIAGTSWRVRTVTPEWAVREQVNQALLDVLPTVLPVLLLLTALGVALMAVMGQEFRQLQLAVQRIGHIEHAVPGLPDSFLKEFRSLSRTFSRVSQSLRQTMQALRTREAELTLSNSQLGATVEELRAVEQSRGEVLNAISHDIKIPLTAIVGYTELLEDEAAGPLNQAQKEYVQGVEENSQRVIRLLEDLLDLTRMEIGRFPIETMPVDVGEALARTQRNLQPLIDRKELVMTVEVAPNLAVVFADPGRLDQVLNNMVSNAIKFTPRGGHLALRAYPAPGGQSAVVQVSDDGAGIPAEHLPHLFERFYRVPGSQAPGTGLGLAISKGLVEAMGGTIGVISEPGKGSTFWFTLPFVGVAPPAATADAATGGREGGP